MVGINPIPFAPNSFSQAPSGLFTPGGTSTMGDLLSSMASPLGGGGGMDVGLARAAGLGAPFGPVQPLLGGAGVPQGGALVNAARELAQLRAQTGAATAIPMGMGGATMPGVAGEAGGLGGLAEAAGAPVAESTAPLWARLLGGNLPSLPGISNLGLKGGISTFLRGIKAAPEAVGAEGEVIPAAEGAAGALNPYSLAAVPATMGLNALLPATKGRQVAADALAGLGAGAGIGAGIGAVGGPIGSGIGALLGAAGGGIYGLFTNKAKPATMQQGEDKITKLMDAAQLDTQARQDLLGNYQLAWAMAQGDHKAEQTIVTNAMAQVPQQRQSMVDRMSQQLAMQQYLPQLQQFMAPSIRHMNEQAQNNYNLISERAANLPGSRGEFLRASALTQLADIQNQARTQQTAMAYYPIMQALATQAQQMQKTTGTGTGATSSNNNQYASAIAQALNPTTPTG